MKFLFIFSTRTWGHDIARAYLPITLLCLWSIWITFVLCYSIGYKSIKDKQLLDDSLDCKHPEHIQLSLILNNLSWSSPQATHTSLAHNKITPISNRKHLCGAWLKVFWALHGGLGPHLPGLSRWCPWALQYPQDTFYTTEETSHT